MLQGYFDDSGKENQFAVITLAGLVAHGEKWRAFSSDWKQLLKRYNIAFFKMREESKRRPISKRDARIAEFVAVIRKHVAFKLESSISVADFRAIVKETFISNIIKLIPPSVGHHDLTQYEATKLLSNPYFWTFHNLIADLCGGIWHRGYRHPFDITFDEQGIDSVIARNSYVIANYVAPARFRRILPAEPIFGDDHTVIPLQAADLFAWITRKVHNQDIAGWEWLVERMGYIESMQCAFLSADALGRQLSAFIEYDARYDTRTTDRWIKALRTL